MTETIKTLLQPIQNRLNAATPGPWGRVDDLYHRFDQVHRIGSESTGSDVAFLIRRDKPQDRADAELIAAAPTDQARLLAAVQAVANECGEVVADSAGLGLDFQEDDFDRGYHAARRQTVQQIVDVVVAALTEAR